MQTVLLILQLFVVISLIVVILLQPSEGGALGFGGNKDFMSVRGTKNVLTKLTTILATCFFVLTLLLIVVSNVAISGSGVLQKIPTTNATVPLKDSGLQVKPITITIPDNKLKQGNGSK
ncbi:preprotein translocase subunit SecG [Bartonella sp. TP]|uniref:preprotein translocase subunit SecG n=1 Tax=Bartonella sp. TP TaxID=3057550 RepID=UPI0025B13C9D|nr:preprotein translocase subunit SecG [Bartonella sp. TP]MDN5249559.1 preprotein translocase subunit SecG [Alphaproteobacteria bacterium]WJW80099.1 preprotein translocase subunit SecG [Bartonella sp. TP]